MCIGRFVVWIGGACWGGCRWTAELREGYEGGPLGAMRVYTEHVRSDDIVLAETMRTFWKQTTRAVCQVSTKIPAIAKVIISLYEFHSITLRKTQLIRTSSGKVICVALLALFIRLFCCQARDGGIPTWQIELEAGRMQPQCTYG